MKNEEGAPSVVLGPYYLGRSFHTSQTKMMMTRMMMRIHVLMVDVIHDR